MPVTSRARVLDDPALRLLLTGVAVSAVGNGLMLPFLMVYLHEVRHLPLGVAGLVVATISGVGLAATAVAGPLVDRVGPRRMLLAANLLMAAGYGAMAFVASAPAAFAAAAVAGAGQFSWSAYSALLGSMVPAARRPRVFGVQFMLLNAGIGVGGLLGGLVAQPGRPATFQVLFLADAATFMAYAGVLLALRGVGGPVPGDDHAALPAAGETAPGGYRLVLADRRFRRVLLVLAGLVTLSYGQLDSGFPPYARAQVGISTRALGLAFAINTGVIVLGQLLVLRVVERYRRSAALAAAALTWAGSWLVLGAAGLVAGGLGLTLCLLMPGLFAVGEMFFSPLSGAITNDLAPARLRGRYNALSSSAWGVAQVVGPAYAGLLLGAGLPGVWIATLTGGLVALAVAGYRLRRVLSPAQDGVPAGALPRPAGSRWGRPPRPAATDLSR